MASPGSPTLDYTSSRKAFLDADPKMIQRVMKPALDGHHEVQSLLECCPDHGRRLQMPSMNARESWKPTLDGKP